MQKMITNPWKYQLQNKKKNKKRKYSEENNTESEFQSPDKKFKGQNAIQQASDIVTSVSELNITKSAILDDNEVIEEMCRSLLTIKTLMNEANNNFLSVLIFPNLLALLKKSFEDVGTMIRRVLKCMCSVCLPPAKPTREEVQELDIYIFKYIINVLSMETIDMKDIQVCEELFKVWPQLLIEMLSHLISGFSNTDEKSGNYLLRFLEIREIQQLLINQKAQVTLTFNSSEEMRSLPISHKLKTAFIMLFGATALNN